MEGEVLPSSRLSSFLPSTVQMGVLTNRQREQRRPLAVPRRPRAVPRRPLAVAKARQQCPALNRQCLQCPAMSHRLDLPLCLLPVPRRFPVRCRRINPRWSHRILLCPAIFPRHCQAWNRLYLLCPAIFPRHCQAWNRV